MGGIYELPSGKVEGGESLDVALLREVEEETGLNVSEILQYIGYFDYESKDGRLTRQFNFVVNVSDFLKIRLTEHDRYALSKREELGRYQVTDSVKSVLDICWEGE